MSKRKIATSKHRFQRKLMNLMPPAELLTLYFQLQVLICTFKQWLYHALEIFAFLGASINMLGSGDSVRELDIKSNKFIF